MYRTSGRTLRKWQAVSGSRAHISLKISWPPAPAVYNVSRGFPLDEPDAVAPHSRHE